MKAELNNELKDRFFALYWGQEVFCWPGVFDQKVSGSTFAGGIDIEDFLFLRPISSITDKEAVEVANIMNVERSDFWTDQFKRFRVYVGDVRNKELDYDSCFAKAGREYVSHFFRTTKWSNHSIPYYEEGLIIHTSDYLRSIGVALPFMGHSVEDLVTAGWIKLTDSQPPSPL